MSPPAPPPPVMEVAADKGCSLGGSMKVEMVRAKGPEVTARVVVRLARWKSNVEVLVVIGHEWNSGLAVTDLVSIS